MSNAVYQHDVIAIYDQAIKNIESKLPEAKRVQRHAKSKLNKAKRVATNLHSIDKYRQDYYAACLDVEAWERRLKIALSRRDKALSDTGYYKVGGSC